MGKTNRLLYFLALLKIIIPYLLQHSIYEPHRDEFLYLAEGRHLAFGFMEVPPMLSIFAWFTYALGNNMFWVKLWPSLFGAATFVVCGKIVQSLGGKAFAIILLFLPFIFGVYLRLFFLFQPNPPEVFFWTMVSFSIIRFIQTNNNKYVYLFGISAAFGMLSKYTIVFYVISILAALLLTKQRSIFLNKHFWLAALLEFIIFLPNLLWQYANHFPVLFHMKELHDTQLQYVSRFDFLKDQLLMNIPCVFIWLAGLWFVSFTASGKPYRFAALTYVFVIALLALGQAKNYYSLGAYPVLFAFGAYHLEKFTSAKRKVLRYIFIAIPVLSGLWFLPIALPILPPQKLADLYVRMNAANTGALKWEDLKNHPLPQDFADMQGWEEMAQKAAKGYNSMNKKEQSQTVFFCDNYGIAGAVNYYAPKYNLPPAFSDNASFLYWMPDSVYITNLLLITDDAQEMQHAFIKDFQSVTLVDSVTNPYAREHGDLIILLKGANEKFNNYFKKKIEDDKKQLLNISTR